MDTLSYKTVSANRKTVSKAWHLIDAEDMIVGRLATTIANLARGKHKPTFSPHVDCGDKVVVINADKVCFTGKKMKDKVYVRHTGYPGGQRFTTPAQLMDRKPTEVLRKAVNNMLPKNKLQQVYLKNVFLYAGTQHPHEAQQPKPYSPTYK